MSDSTPKWSGRPSLRPIKISAAASAFVGVFASIELMPRFLGPINAYAAENQTLGPAILAMNVFFFLMCFGPLIFSLWSMLDAYVTRYDLADGRLTHRHGIIIRKHDKIEMRHVRDMRVRIPLGARLLGTGYVFIMSKDERAPVLAMGPFSDPNVVEAILHIETRRVTRQAV